MSTWIDTIPGPRLEPLLENHGEALKARHHTEDPLFAIWLEALNRAVQRRAGVSYDDLEDWNYRDYYESGVPPTEAAIEMLEDQGWDLE